MHNAEKCPGAQKGEYREGDCRICWLVINRGLNPDIQVRSGPSERMRGKLSARLTCRRRGAAVRRMEIPGCTAPPVVYTCERYGECVLLRDGGRRREAIERSGLPICRECEDRIA